MTHRWVFLMWLLLHLCSAANEKALQTALMNGYSRDVRPVNADTDTLQVKIGLAIRNAQEVSILLSAAPPELVLDGCAHRSTRFETQ